MDCIEEHLESPFLEPDQEDFQENVKIEPQEQEVSQFFDNSQFSNIFAAGFFQGDIFLFFFKTNFCVDLMFTEMEKFFNK